MAASLEFISESCRLNAFNMANKKLGIAVVGIGGAVGTTMVAGIELIKKSLVSTDGLPLAGIGGGELFDYCDIVFAGWDLFPEHLAKAAEQHDVLTHKQFVAVEEELTSIKPWPAISDSRFLAKIDGVNGVSGASHRDSIARLRQDLAKFKKTTDSVVVINLASTEKLAAEGNEAFNSLGDFEHA